MEIFYNKKHTINTGNYSSVAIEIGLKKNVNIEQGETKEEALDKAIKFVETNLEKEASKYAPNGTITKNKTDINLKSSGEWKHLPNKQPTYKDYSNVSNDILKTDIKYYMIDLLSKDQSNREYIKEELSKRGATKFNELKDEYLNEFIELLIAKHKTYE